MTPIRVGLVTVSDRCSRGETVDTSGPALAAMVEAVFDGRVLATACVPDQKRTITMQIRNMVTDYPYMDLILTTGGTGLSPRDVTPEATEEVLERRHPGLMELIRLRCYEKTPRTYLSRGVAGTLRHTLIINLPGSERGATECLAALEDVLPHAIETLRGEVVDDGRPEVAVVIEDLMERKTV